MTYDSYLHQKQAANHTGGSAIDSNTMEKLANLMFVVNDRVIGNDGVTVIHSLMREFNRLSAIEIHHDLELSQFYAGGHSLADKHGRVVCENCAIALKYFNAAVCVGGGKIRILNETTGAKPIDCQIHRGVVKLFLKQMKGYTCKYIPIRVVNIKSVDSLKQYGGHMYTNNEAIQKLTDDAAIAISKSQSSAVRSLARGGQLSTSTPSDLDAAMKYLEELMSPVQEGAVEGQEAALTSSKTFSPVPDYTSLSAANVVARDGLSQTTSIKNGTSMAVAVPGGENIPLNTVTSNIDPNCFLDYNGAKHNSSNTGSANNSKGTQATLNVDSDVVVVPKTDVSSTNKVAASAQNLGSKAKDLTAKTGQVVGDVTAKGDDLLQQAATWVEGLVNSFKGGPTVPVAAGGAGSNHHTLVQVSDYLSVLTPLSPADGSANVPSVDREHSSAPITTDTRQSNKANVERMNNRLDQTKPIQSSSSSSSNRTANSAQRSQPSSSNSGSTQAANRTPSRQSQYPPSSYAPSQPQAQAQYQPQPQAQSQAQAQYQPQAQSQTQSQAQRGGDHSDSSSRSNSQSKRNQSSQYNQAKSRSSNSKSNNFTVSGDFDDFSETEGTPRKGFY